MARARKQFKMLIVDIRDLMYDKDGMLCIKRGDVRDPEKAMYSTEQSISENRLFRKFSKDTEKFAIDMKDKFGNKIIQDGENALGFVELPVAKEFAVIDFSKAVKGKKNKKKFGAKVAKVLKNGVRIYFEDGTSEVFKRCVTSASQTRQKKRLYCMDNEAKGITPEIVRYKGSFGAVFEKGIIAKIESRYGQMTSSSMEIPTTKYEFSFDIMPDASFDVELDAESYCFKQRDIVRKKINKSLKQLDGQGTILPLAATQAAYNLDLISRREFKHISTLIRQYDQDIQAMFQDIARFPELHKETYNIWKKIPSAFQIRFGFAKGLLVVFPHNLKKYHQDCRGNTYRSADTEDNGRLSKANKFFGEDVHHYDFNKDIMFTDSMWKENFDSYYVSEDCPVEDRVPLEIVLWQKPKPAQKTYMGNQFWQAIDTKLDVRHFAKRAIDAVKDTVLTDANHAMMFLSQYDTGHETGGEDSDDFTYAEKMQRAGSKIQKITETLHEQPRMIKEGYVQKSIRSIFEMFIDNMHDGRIPVQGHNPYLATSPEAQFGIEPILQAGEYYYNGLRKTYAGFRSPLIDRSESVVIKTVRVDEYNFYFRDLLILNPYDDTLQRMGGADTDGDKIAMTDDPQIIASVDTTLPLLLDDADTGDIEEVPVNTEEIFAFDDITITKDAKTIGEITNYALTFKDLLDNPEKMGQLNLTEEMIINKVKILRFMQGWSIDYAKTGFFPEDDFKLHQLEIKLSPDWNPWSEALIEFDPQAEVYESQSAIGRLHRGIRGNEAKGTKGYLDAFRQMEDFKPSNFVAEMTAGANGDDIDALKPIIEPLERGYRMELNQLQYMNLKDDDRRAMVNDIINKYERAILSIDADIATIAACAYDVSYHAQSDNRTKKSNSFAWTVAYEGLLLNMAASNTGDRTKFRKVIYNGHIDNIPAELSFYRGKCAGEDYDVTAKVPNGTYKVMINRKKAQVYIIMKSKSISNVVEKRGKKMVPAQKHLPFTLTGFRYTEAKNAHKALELLKENDGVITLNHIITKDDDSKIIGVFAGDTRIGSVNRHYYTGLKDLVPFQAKVTNVDKLEPMRYSKKTDNYKDASAFDLDTVYMNAVEVEEMNASTGDHNATEYGYADYTVPSDLEVPSEDPIYNLEDIDFDLDVDVDPVYEAIEKTAAYWDVEVTKDELNIATVSVEKVGKFKDDVCAKITINTVSGKSYTFDVGVARKNEFKIISERPLKEKFNALLLQIAHYELYKMVMSATA